MLSVLRHPSRWTVRGLLVVLALVLAGLLIWFAVQVFLAVTALSRAAAQAETVQVSLLAGDRDRADIALEQLRDDVETATSNTDGPLWWVASKVPFLGDDAAALATVSETLSVAVNGALPPLLDVGDQLDDDLFAVNAGTVDLALFTTIAPALDESETAFRPSLEELDRVDAGSLVGRVRDPFIKARTQLQSVGDLLGSASKAAGLMPTLLGAEGPRTYLVAVQSNAETRPLGGVPGTWLLVSAEGGRLTIERTGSSIDLLALRDPAVALSPEEVALYGATTATDFRNSMLNPHFPRSAEIASAIFAARQGVVVDGVIAVDPVTLAFVLLGTGPVQASDGSQLTAENAVSRLLNEAYAQYPDADDQNEFFESTARAVFDAFTSGTADSTAIIGGISAAAAERRVLIWMRDPDLQAQISGEVIAGEFGPDEGTSPTVGIFLSDRTEAKLEYYLASRSVVTSTGCVDDQQQLAVRTTLTSSVPGDALLLPPTITGTGPHAPVGTIVLRLRYYSPSGGSIESLTIDGEPVPFEVHVSDGRVVAYVEVRLEPLSEKVVRLTMESGSGQTSAGVMVSTPGILPKPNEAAFQSSC